MIIYFQISLSQVCLPATPPSPRPPTTPPPTKEAPPPPSTRRTATTPSLTLWPWFARKLEPVKACLILPGLLPKSSATIHLFHLHQQPQWQSPYLSELQVMKPHISKELFEPRSTGLWIMFPLLVSNLIHRKVLISWDFTEHIASKSETIPVCRICLVFRFNMENYIFSA